MSKFKGLVMTVHNSDARNEEAKEVLISIDHLYYTISNGSTEGEKLSYDVIDNEPRMIELMKWKN